MEIWVSFIRLVTLFPMVLFVFLWNNSKSVYSLYHNQISRVIDDKNCSTTKQSVQNTNNGGQIKIENGVNISGKEANHSQNGDSISTALKTDRGDIDKQQTRSGIESNIENRQNVYEFPSLKRLDPGFVGQDVGVTFEDGKSVHRITRAIQPPIFEIPDFLSEEECDFIIARAIEAGLQTSALFGASIERQLSSGKQSSDIDRISQNTWLNNDLLGQAFVDKLTNRLSILTDLPQDLILRSEPMQVVNYGVGGHYHAHLDSSDNLRLPCCFQTDCSSKANTPQWNQCCRICRFVTVMYYLSDVEQGGETAFPFADIEDARSANLYGNREVFNLSRHCYNSSLVVSPKKGKAVVWYNHYIDEKGYLGPVDLRSYHGGCDVTRGTKWIATSWLSAAPYSSRFEPSLFYNEP